MLSVVTSAGGAIVVSVYLLVSTMSLVTTWNGNHAGAFVSRNSQFKKISLDDSISDLAFSPNGSLLAAGGFHKRIRFWNTRNWQAVREIEHAGELTEIAFSPSGKLLAGVVQDSESSALLLWDVTSGTNVGKYSEADNKKTITSIAFSPDGSLLAVGFSTGQVKTIHVANATINHIGSDTDTLVSLDSGVASLSFSPDSTLLAVGAGKGISGPKDFGKVLVIEVQGGRQVLSYRALSSIYSLSFTPDGKTLAIAGPERKGDEMRLKLKTINTSNWKENEIFKRYPAGEWMGFSNDGRLLVSAFLNPPNSSLVINDLQKQRVLRTIQTRQTLQSVALSPDGRSVAVGSEGGTIYVYPTERTESPARKDTL